jgi:hypothetical protein
VHDILEMHLVEHQTHRPHIGLTLISKRVESVTYIPLGKFSFKRKHGVLNFSVVYLLFIYLFNNDVSR